MFDKLKSFKIYFILISAVTLLSFYGSYNFETNISNPDIQLVDTFILYGHPASNNGGSAGWAIFFDLIAGPNNIIVTRMASGNNGAANVPFSVEVLTRSGTALGGPVGSGPGSSYNGWTVLDTVPAFQGGTSSGISLVFDLPPISVPAGDTVGVAVRFYSVGPRYYGTGTPPYSVFSDTNITLITGDVRSAPFTPSGSFFTSRALTGEIHYIIDNATGVGGINTEIPNGYRLSQNYPNPFNPATKIRYELPQNGYVKLTVFDILGKEIEKLVNEQQSAGIYEITFNAAKLPSGVYLYRLETESFSDVKRMMLIK